MDFKTGNALADPSDFKPTKVPKLYELDSLLRCHICKEFMVAPMLTSCGHSFCSMCIRKYLIDTPKCPICAKELRESHLSRNVLLEEVVISYKDLRPDLLKHLTVAPKPVNPRVHPKSKIEQEVIDLDEMGSDSLDDDEVQIIEEHTKKRKHAAGNSIDSLFKRKRQEPKSSDVEMGECPVCQKSFPLRDLQTTHIDLCLSGEESPPPPQSESRSVSPQSTTPQTQSSSPFFQPRVPTTTYQKLSKVDFPSLSNSVLKSKLMKLELPVTGTRAQLETRYNEYLILWNANCDSVNPRNPRVLRKQLAQWESSLSFKVKSKKQLDKEGWRELINQAKATLQKSKPIEQSDAPVGDANEKTEDPILVVSQEERFFVY